MADTDGNIVDPVVKNPATPEEPIVTPPVNPDDGKGKTSQTQEPTTYSEEQYDELKQKYSASSTEARKLKDESETAKRELLETVTDSKELFEKYVDKKGLTPEEKEYYMNMYSTQIAPGKLIETPNADGKTPTEPNVQPIQQAMDPVRQEWMRKMDEQTRSKLDAQGKATSEFFSQPENSNLQPTVQKAITQTAAMLDEEYGYSPSDALSAARQRILNLDAIKEEGYAEGVRDAYQGGVSRGIASGAGAQRDEVQLPARDEAFVAFEAKRRNLDADATEKFKKEYATRLKKRNS